MDYQWSMVLYNHYAYKLSSVSTNIQAQGTHLRVGIPISSPPLHFKRYPAERSSSTSRISYEAFDELYFNADVPWEGTFIRYMRAMANMMKWASLEFAPISGGARARSPDGSAYTAAAMDVGGHVSDLAAGAFWVTRERTEIVTWSVPIYTDTIYLWVPRPAAAELTFWMAAGRVFEPFSGGLWALLVLVIFVNAIFDMWLQRNEWRAYVNEVMAARSTRASHEQAQPPGQAWCVRWCSRHARYRAWLIFLEWLDRLRESSMHMTIGLQSTRGETVGCRRRSYGSDGPFSSS